MVRVKYESGMQRRVQLRVAPRLYENIPSRNRNESFCFRDFLYLELRELQGSGAIRGNTIRKRKEHEYGIRKWSNQKRDKRDR